MSAWAIMRATVDSPECFSFHRDNSKAKSKGEKQVHGYLPSVVEYYQAFFEDGRNAGTNGEPDSEHGGEKFLQELKASKHAWSSDGSHLDAIPEVKTYNMCEKKLGN
jgi:hypothetical protein